MRACAFITRITWMVWRKRGIEGGREGGREGMNEQYNLHV